VDRGFDPDAADPLGGLTAHANNGDAPVDLLGARLSDQPSAQRSAVRTRPWSWQAMRALFTAWEAIASTYRSDASVDGVDDDAIRSGQPES
jgi:hypothetical protein